MLLGIIVWNPASHTMCNSDVLSKGVESNIPAASTYEWTKFPRVQGGGVDAGNLKWEIDNMGAHNDNGPSPSPSLTHVQITSVNHFISNFPSILCLNTQLSRSLLL